MDQKIIDLHVHAGGSGLGGTGCYMSERAQARVSFRMLQKVLGISEQQKKESLDEALKIHLFKSLDSAPSLSAAVVLAYDQIYTTSGEVDARTDMYVPNDYVMRLRDEHPKILFGASVHPDRPGAIEELERCAQAGAALLKWLPANQCMDPSEKRYIPFYRKLKELHLPLLVHTGSEFVFPSYRKELNHPEYLQTPLEEGVTVIAAHAATSSMLISQNYSRYLIRMMRQYANLFADNSALSSQRGWGLLKRYQKEGLTDRLLHGSDYPIPPEPVCFAFSGDLTFQKCLELRKIPNLLERDIQTKLALGYPLATFERAKDILRLKR